MGKLTYYDTISTGPFSIAIYICWHARGDLQLISAPIPGLRANQPSLLIRLHLSPLGNTSPVHWDSHILPVEKPWDLPNSSKFMGFLLMIIIYWMIIPEMFILGSWLKHPDPGWVSLSARESWASSSNIPRPFPRETHGFHPTKAIELFEFSPAADRLESW